MRTEQLDILDELPKEKVEVLDKLPEGEVLTFSMAPKGNRMEVFVRCSFHIDFAIYESVRDEVMRRILEIKKVIREAEKRLDI
jgi:hypothetical protein